MPFSCEWWADIYHLSAQRCVLRGSESHNLKVKAFWSRSNGFQAPNEKEKMAADVSLHSLLLTQHRQEGGGGREGGRGEQRGAHVPSPPGSIFPVPPAVAALLSACTGCTYPAAGRKTQGIFQVAFKYPQDPLGFLMRKTSFLFELTIP